MKHTKQCPKCESRKLGYINYQPEGTGDSFGWRVVARVREPQRHETMPRIAELEAYVCTECGFYESYVRDPTGTKWDDLSGFRMINPEPDSEGPYR